MRRTLAIRVYTTDYNTVLEDNTNNAVRLCYGNMVNGQIVNNGIVVPGGEFVYMGHGVWERPVITDGMTDYRTDYYFVEYTADGGTTWLPVSGYAPFFFNTKILSAHVSYSVPISGLKPKATGIMYTHGTIKFTLPSMYDGDMYPINPGHAREMQYASTDSTDNPRDPWPYTVTSASSVIDMQRVGPGFVENKYIHSRSRVVNPITGESSGWSDPVYKKLESKSTEEIVDAEIATPDNMETGDAYEYSTWGNKDSIYVKLCALPKGQYWSVYVQFGGAEPTLNEGILTPQANGFEVAAYDTKLIVPKPLTLETSYSVYICRKILGMSSESDWIGKTDSLAHEIENVSPVVATSVMSASMLEALTDYVATKLQTADGIGISKKG